jgi:probable HAF family extracellular repeat protein
MKSKFYKIFHMLAAIILFFSQSEALSNQVYRVTNLGTLGGSHSVCFAINELGWAVGNSETDILRPGSDEYYQSHAFLWTPQGGMQDLGCLGDGWRSSADDINDSGQVIGRSTIDENDIRGNAFYWTLEGGLQMLGPPDERYVAGGINDLGQVAARKADPVDEQVIIWTKDDGVRYLGDPNPLDYGNQPYDINNKRDIIGTHYLWTEERGFQNLKDIIDPNSEVKRGVFEAINDNGYAVGLGSSAIYSGMGQVPIIWNINDGEIRSLGTLGCTDSPECFSEANRANDINNFNQVVGILSGQTNFQAFIWDERNGMRDLNELIPKDSVWYLEDALAINDAGQICAIGQYNGNRQALILTPLTKIINDIIDFINDHEDIEGVGPGNSANNKYNAFMNMLLTVSDLIEAGDSKGVCGLLNSIIKKCDGLPKPPDFIDGNADTVGTLTGMLDDLTASLGCE